VTFFKPNNPPAQLYIARAATIFVAIILLMGVLYYAFSHLNLLDESPHTPVDQGGLHLPRAPSLLGAGGHGGEAVAPTSAAHIAGLSPASSLANTQTDGEWSIGANGQPQPSRALRRRFDYLLLQQGEVSLDSVAQQIRQQVQIAHGAATAQKIMALWDSYLRLQQHAWTVQVNMQRPATWTSALAERSTVRRQLLGPAWADAFYRDEENELKQMIAQASSDLPAAAAVQAYTPIPLPDAAQRNAEHEAQWQHWEHRLDAARIRVQELRSAPELSEPQRQEAIQIYVHQQFNAGELLRVKALLKI
jgi:lipase chaperone LimK